MVSSVFFCMIRKEKTLCKSYISGSSQPQCILLFCSCVTKFGWVASASSMSLCRDTGVTEMGFLVLVANLCEIYVCRNQTVMIHCVPGGLSRKGCLVFTVFGLSRISFLYFSLNFCNDCFCFHSLGFRSNEDGFGYF